MSSLKFFFLSVLLLTTGKLFAQNKDGIVHLPDSIHYPYIQIVGVEIKGNKLTKPQIITRELDFKTGDSLAAFNRLHPISPTSRIFIQQDSTELKMRLNYSRDNIINTRLFLTVNISMIHFQDNKYKLLIEVTERNYFWIFPIIKLNSPNINEWLRDPKWSDISMGLFSSYNNLWGLNHQSAISFYFGKSWGASFGYHIPWIGHGQKVGLKVGVTYKNNYAVEYAALENKRQMIYEANSSQEVKAVVALNLRPKLYNYGTIRLTGEYTMISDSVFKLDSNYLAANKKKNLSLSLYADYYYDSRNSHSYPLSGSMLKVFVNKIGLGIVNREVDLFYYGVDFHFYQKIGNKFYVAEMFKAENSSGQNYPFYYQLNMTSKHDFIRGFDLYTLKGDQMYYSRNNIKYELIKPSIKKAKPGQEGNKFKNLQYAFYLNIFADAGFVRNKFTKNNPLCNKMLFSWGTGIDFVSYYDLVLRFEYAWTSTWHNGFFIAFGMPI
ncbi:MAG: BamA/TamA family outer membrane protein [Bacteroidota bacterium]